jgi:hypothetical protein
MSNNRPKILSYQFTDLVESIYTPIELYIGPYDPKTSLARSALWDTGAEFSAVTSDVVKRLKLSKYDEAPVVGFGGEVMTDVVHVSLMFPNQTFIEDIEVAVADVDPDVGIILGMDIISQLDFALSNAGGKTLFSFAIPPFEKKFNFEHWSE